MVGYLFAGQGSQYVGMGKDLYQSFAEARVVFDTADKVLGFSISRLMFEGPQEELTKTQNCQPAILTISIAAWEVFKTVIRYPLSVIRYAAGLSLGEYSALVAAEAISFEDAVYLVRRRGEFMEEEAVNNPGSMASIIGLDLNAIKSICAKTNTEIANINCPGQTVISGSSPEIKKAELMAQEQGAKRVILLEVSGAFHSSLMKLVSLRLKEELDKIKVNTPKFSVISNVTAKPVAGAAEIKANLIKQVAASVLWDESMRFILAQGVSKFFEFGPGKVLKGLMRRINENAEVMNIEKRDDLSKLQGVMQDEA